MSACPTPSDWLDWLEGADLPDPGHLDACPGCRAYVEELRAQEEQFAGFDFDSDRRSLDLSAFVRFSPVARDSGPVRGQIWWSAASWDGAAAYQDVDKVLFVILDESIEAGERWFEAAPVWPDVELANELDLILEGHHTSLAIPLRLQLRRRITLAYEQLDAQLGRILDEGFPLIDAAFEGRAEADVFGVPYENEFDWRLKLDRRIAELLETLQAPYYATLAETVDALAEADVLDTSSEGQVLPFRVTWADPRTSARPQPAFAASVKPFSKRGLELQLDKPRLHGYLWSDIKRGVLLFEVKEVAKYWLGTVELLVGLKGGGTVRSEPFEPSPGRQWAFGQGAGLTHQDVDPNDVRAVLRDK